MNRRISTALLLILLGVPCAFGADDDKKPRDMSPEARLLGDLEHIEAPPDGWFKPEPE